MIFYMKMSASCNLVYIIRHLLYINALLVGGLV